MAWTRTNTHGSTLFFGASKVDDIFENTKEGEIRLSVEIIELKAYKNKNLPVTALNKDKAVHSYGSCIDTISFELDILGEPAHFCVNITESQVKLTDIVPLARKVSTKITELVIERVRRSGQNIPCHQGCSACCNFLVPLSIPEALCLREDVFAMPEFLRGLIEQSCFSATQRLLKRKPPKSFITQFTSRKLIRPVELKVLANWYDNFKQPCSLLHEGRCIIYEQRPLSCREYFIKGSAGACKGKGDPAEVIKMPVLITEALGRLTSELEGTRVEAVIMPLVFVWYEENWARDERTWPAAVMVQRFIDIIKTMLN